MLDCNCKGGRENNIIGGAINAGVHLQSFSFYLALTSFADISMISVDLFSAMTLNIFEAVK